MLERGATGTKSLSWNYSRLSQPSAAGAAPLPVQSGPSNCRLPVGFAAGSNRARLQLRCQENKSATTKPAPDCSQQRTDRLRGGSLSCETPAALSSPGIHTVECARTSLPPPTFYAVRGHYRSVGERCGRPGRPQKYLSGGCPKRRGPGCRVTTGWPLVSQACKNQWPPCPLLELSYRNPNACPFSFVRSPVAA